VRVCNDHLKERAGRPKRGLPVVRWRSSGLRPSLATADSLPSSHGQSGGCRRPQVLRSARTCAALCSTAMYQYRVGAKKRWSPPWDCPSSGGEAQGCALRSPQQIVCRRRTGSPAAIAAHKCFATLALVLPSARRRLYYCRVGRRRGLVGPRRGGAIVPRAARVRGGMTAAASLLAY
jgi:hypothetical protein